MQQGISINALFYGDNLDILREYVPDESDDYDAFSGEGTNELT